MHVIGTAGHVDHGKSTLVQALTGIDPDRFEEEKRRGLTIDLGFAWLTLPSGNSVGIVDVPGHERFIKNMLAGAGGVSVCLFVVAANEGWKPQSAEHLAILDLLGVRRGVVALTKSDTVDAAELGAIRSDVAARLAPSSLASAPVIACSGTTGEGLDELVAALDEVLGATPPPADEGRPRLWVDRVFTIAGAGTVVTGTLTGGSFSIDDRVAIAPEGRTARIRKIQSHKESMERIGPGNRVALNLAGLERQGAERGDAIVAPGQWESTTRVDVRLTVVARELAGFEHELTDRGAHLLHVGSAETPVRVKLLSADALLSGESGYASLYLRDPLPVGRGDRFVLRDAGRIRTVGGGVILDPLPAVSARRGDAARLALLERLDGAAPPDALRALVNEAGSLPASLASFRSGASSIPDGVKRAGDRLMSAERWAELGAALREALTRHHAEHPLQKGMAREDLRAAVGLEPDEFEPLVAGDDDTVEEGPLVRLGSHRVALDDTQARARASLLERLDSAGFTPPITKELDVERALLRSLAEAGDIVKIDSFYLSAARAAEARRLVRDAIEASGPKTVAEIRDLLGTTRKYAVPLCEWLDSTGATTRRGDVRTLGPHP